MFERVPLRSFFLQGYKSILCGACDEGHGKIKSVQCKKCRSKRATIAIYVLAALWSVGLVAALVRNVLSLRKFVTAMHVLLSLPESRFVSRLRLK